MNDPQQELFTKVKLGLEVWGYSVYDGTLPPENTPYPFIYLGDCQQTDDTNKGAVFGKVYLTIHVWHNNVRQRGTVSEMLFATKDVCRKVRRTDNFKWDVKNVTQNIYPDNTTQTPLLHGVLEVEWQFS